MAIDLTTLDAHEQPSPQLKGKWKAYSRTEHSEFLGSHPDIDCPTIPEKWDEFCLAKPIPKETLAEAFQELLQDDQSPLLDHEIGDVPTYYHPLLPGLIIIPSLIPPGIQKALLNRLIHRDLSSPTNQTNLHLHYTLPYPSAPASSEPSPNPSFFTLPPTSPTAFPPKDPAIHSALTIRQVLTRKLSWLTLGGQYDWTNREYPAPSPTAPPPPSFPGDIARCLQTLFPETQAQAAIVNFYSPGDTMMMHRDVSEESSRGLVSVSMGCDALFMIAGKDFGKGNGDNGSVNGEDGGKDGLGGVGKEAGGKPYLLLRLKSGDAIYMSEEARYAWHGVPKVVKGTCPEFLADWPAEGDAGGEGMYEEWRGWMRNKRVNLNVRQMKD